MKILVTAVFLMSGLSLFILLLRNQSSRKRFQQLIIHWLVAGVILFGINYFQFTQAFAVPINLMTLGTTAILGLPGLALLVGVQYII